ncbi:hypothetical protein LCGC14_2505320, partial [marine sediment metagenome]
AILEKIDGYKALAERRGKALGGLLAYVTEMARRTRWQPKEMLPDGRIGTARATINMKPEEAKEKEGQGE